MSTEEQLAPVVNPSSQTDAGNDAEILSKNHRLQLRYTFQYIDAVLTEVVCAKLNVTRPMLVISLAASLMKQQLYRQAYRELGSDLRSFLNGYSRQLRSWFREVITNLRASFLSTAGIHRVDLEPIDGTCP